MITVSDATAIGILITTTASAIGGIISSIVSLHGKKISTNNAQVLQTQNKTLESIGSTAGRIEENTNGRLDALIRENTEFKQEILSLRSEIVSLKTQISKLPLKGPLP